jgi:hypothetical protein
VQGIFPGEREKPESLLQFNIPGNHYPGWVSFRYPPDVCLKTRKHMKEQEFLDLRDGDLIRSGCPEPRTSSRRRWKLSSGCLPVSDILVAMAVRRILARSHISTCLSFETAKETCTGTFPSPLAQRRVQPKGNYIRFLPAFCFSGLIISRLYRRRWGRSQLSSQRTNQVSDCNASSKRFASDTPTLTSAASR